jgi:hypothetical protein
VQHGQQRQTSELEMMEQLTRVEDRLHVRMYVCLLILIMQ